MTGNELPALTWGYLDPVSWFAALQLLGGVSAWLTLHLRRLRRRGRGVSDDPEAVEIGVADAMNQLGAETPAPRLVVAMEGPRDWPYLEDYLLALRDVEPDLEIWLVAKGGLPDLTSSGLGRTKVVFEMTGTEWRRLMSGLTDATVLTTVTDLGSRPFPKSTRVRYIYAFHSLVSTHVAYRPEAFDAYDVILSPSRQHTAEIRARENSCGLDAKVIVEAGYPYADRLTARALDEPEPPTRTVVIAPSWTSDGQYPTTWLPAARAFAREGWAVLLRPHPETMKRSRAVMLGVASAIVGDNRIKLDRSAQNGALLPNVSALVSDWSGAAIEFAVAGRPVAFVDTPRKVRNKAWRATETSSVEQDLRSVAGIVVPPSRVTTLPSLLSAHADADLTTQARTLLYNPSRAAEVGARTLVAHIRRPKP